MNEGKSTTWLHCCAAYLEMCKPRVVMLMLLTAIVGMCLASPAMVPWQALLFGTLGIALAAGSAAVLNHLIDRKIDGLMRRTENRPLPQGQITVQNALIFAILLGICGLVVLLFFVNTLTTILTFATLLGYGIIYTVFLKHATPQNIVIGGLAGAMPPLLGWTAVTSQIDPHSLLLVLIIFTWTPPHFWALAIYRYKEYEKAGIPMLPITHGIAYTQLQIFLYTLLMSITTILPFLTGLSGLIYLVGALLLDAGFIYWATLLLIKKDDKTALKTFIFSIYYLMGLFIVLLVDHYLRITYLG